MGREPQEPQEPALCLQERPRSPDPADCQRHAGPSQQPSQPQLVRHTDLHHPEPALTSPRGCHLTPGSVLTTVNWPSERSKYILCVNLSVVIIVIICIQTPLRLVSQNSNYQPVETAGSINFLRTTNDC